MASSINPYVQTQQTSLKSRPLSRQKLPVLDERSTSPRTTNYRPSTVSGDFRTKLFEFSFRKISRTSNSCLIHHRQFYCPTRVSCNGLQEAPEASQSLHRTWRLHVYCLQLGLLRQVSKYHLDPVADTEAVLPSMVNGRLNASPTF